MFGRRLAIGLLCAAMASSALAGGVQAQEPALSARDVPGLVSQARDGDMSAVRRLEAWIASARAGEAAALRIAAVVINDGIVADRPLIDDLERQAAAEGFDARTGFARAVLAGDQHVSVAQAVGALAATEGQPAVDAASSLTSFLDTDLNGRVLLADFPAPDVDPEDVFDLVESDDPQVSVANGSSKTRCTPINYYDAITGLTVMGMEVCIGWRYDYERYVSHGTRTISPYVSLVGTAYSWRWVGTNVADKYYFNYKRVGAKSGWHTKTVGHFQHCPSQLVVVICDQDELPLIILDGHFNGTSSSKAKP